MKKPTTRRPTDSAATFLKRILGDEDQSSLEMSLLGFKEAERDLTHFIGQHFVNGDDDLAGDSRDRLYRAQTCREICERLLAEVRG